jgi:hypothetical protein
MDVLKRMAADEVLGKRTAEQVAEGPLADTARINEIDAESPANAAWISPRCFASAGSRLSC